MLPSLFILVVSLVFHLIFELMSKAEDTSHRNFDHVMSKFHQPRLFTDPCLVVIWSKVSIRTFERVASSPIQRFAAGVKKTPRVTRQLGDRCHLILQVTFALTV